MISGVITSVLLLAFIGVAVWAYSGGRRERFEEASRLPLAEDVAPHPAEPPACCREKHS